MSFKQLAKDLSLPIPGLGEYLWLRDLYETGRKTRLRKRGLLAYGIGNSLLRTTSLGLVVPGIFMSDSSLFLSGDLPYIATTGYLLFGKHGYGL